MKTVRINLQTYRELLHVKHEQEIIKMDVVNMSDVLDVVMDRYRRLVNGEDLEEVLERKYVFSAEADVVAKPLDPGDDEEETDDEEEEEEETPKPRRKKASRPSGTKARKKRTE